MPDKETLKRARKDRAQGKAASTQAGEFVREEIEHVREGKHGARSAKQLVAIGLSKARRAGIDVPPKKAGTKRGGSAVKSGRGAAKPSAKRSRATTNALKKEGSAAASHEALSRQARRGAR
jgi:hypothetical protein